MPSIPENYHDRYDIEPFLETGVEVREHMHNVQRWYCATSGTNVAPMLSAAENVNFAPFIVSAHPTTAYLLGPVINVKLASDALGLPAWVTDFDMHHLFITTTSGSGLYLLRFIYGIAGETSAVDAVANGNFTDVMFSVTAAPPRVIAIEMMSKLVPVTERVWVQVQCDTPGRTVSFVLGLHFNPTEEPPPPPE